MKKYWIGVASQEHVQGAVSGGFAQVCHGKPGPLRQMQGGDWLVYYSPTFHFGKKDGCRAFTAIGKVKEGDPYPFSMSPTFHPWRRNVHYVTAQHAPIEPLIEQLSFIKEKTKWGFPFRRGCFTIPEEDFQRIASAMGIVMNE